MSVFYEDLSIYTSVLKKLIKYSHPDIDCCFICKKNPYDDDMPQNIKVLATLFISIRRSPYGNTTSIEIADIYNNGMIRPLTIIGTELCNIINYWLWSKVENAIQRHENRMKHIKNELLEKILVQYSE